MKKAYPRDNAQKGGSKQGSYSGGGRGGYGNYGGVYPSYYPTYAYPYGELSLCVCVCVCVCVRACCLVGARGWLVISFKNLTLLSAAGGAFRKMKTVTLNCLQMKSYLSASATGNIKCDLGISLSDS